jgi:integrase
MSKQQSNWKLYKDSWISTTPVLPGVWKRKEGGHVVRGRVKDPKTGRQTEIWKVLPELTAPEALVWLNQEVDQVRRGGRSAPKPKQPFASYAVSLLKQKVAAGDIKSKAGVEKWETTLSRLIRGSLGDFFVEAIEPRDVLRWRSEQAKLIQLGKYAPATMNTDLAVLKVILKHAKIELGLRSNAAEDIASFDLSQHPTYSREEPNSLTAAELRDFLAQMRADFPQHYAMTYCGFATGLRPSTLRPLRRNGATPDVLWDEGKLLIRRSHTRGDVEMIGTKTGGDDEISVPTELIDVLRWHVRTQLRPGPQQESELLFPSEVGGYRSPSALDKPFAAVTKAIELKKRITPRAMRRSFQDLCRTAEVKDVVARSICGHATEAMTVRYSSVSEQEQVEGLARVIRLMDRGPKAKPAPAPSGEDCGEGRSASGEGRP